MVINMENQELTSLFEEGLFIPDLKAETKEEALTELVDLLLSQDKMQDKEILLEMLRQRESLGSTGIGKGIAIPHGRTLTVSKLIIVFGKSEKGIQFDAVDGEPARLIFMIIAPYQDRKNLYLVVLGKLSELMRKKKIRDGLLKVNTFEEFQDIIKGVTQCNDY